MNSDCEICLCFHVSRRKIVNYLRNHSLRRASQLSECQGAGTGCGWCRPFLDRLFQEHQQSSFSEQPGEGLEQGGGNEWLDAAEYARRREVYLKTRRKSDVESEAEPEAGPTT